MTASIVSLRAVTTETGRTAIAAAAASPARPPNSPRTRSYTAATVAVPAIAAGRTSANVVNPRRRVLATWSQRSAGGLSIATRAPGSNAPTRNACHDVAMLRTAAS